MHDTFLFKKIVEQVFELCRENHIYKITYIEIDVNEHSHVNKETLLDVFLDEIPELVDFDTSIQINKGDTEPLIAVIKSLEGIDDETLCD